MVVGEDVEADTLHLPFPRWYVVVVLFLAKGNNPPNQDFSSVSRWVG